MPGQGQGNQGFLSEITLRDYFAVHAMQKLMEYHCNKRPWDNLQQIVASAYIFAEAMMLEREEEHEIQS